MTEGEARSGDGNLEKPPASPSEQNTSQGIRTRVSAARRSVAQYLGWRFRGLLPGGTIHDTAEAGEQEEHDPRPEAARTVAVSEPARDIDLEFNLELVRNSVIKVGSQYLYRYTRGKGYTAEKLLAKSVYRGQLHNTGILKWTHLPGVAQLWLEELKSTGLPEFVGSLRAPPKEGRRGYKDFLSRFSGGGRYPVRLDTGQVMWLNLDVPMQPEGYRLPEVQDRPSATHRALLTALAILETASSPVNNKWRPKDTRRLRDEFSRRLPKIFSLMGSPIKPMRDYTISRRRIETFPLETEEERKSYFEWLETLPGGKEEVELDRLLAGHDRTIEFALALLRYYRPDFDELPPRTQVVLVDRTCNLIFDISDQSRKLVSFLEYGNSDGELPRNVVTNRQDDVWAAVLRHVKNMKDSEIADWFGYEPTGSEAGKTDRQRARKSADRGEEFMKQALGEEGWRSFIEASKDEVSRRETMSKEERLREDIPEAVMGLYLENGMSEQDVRQMIDQQHGRDDDTDDFDSR